MIEEASLKWTVAWASVAAGLAADALLRITPWGINLVLWLLPTMALVAWLSHRNGWLACGRSNPGRLVPPTWTAGLLLVVFSLAMAWRDSHTLKRLDLLALGIVLAWGRARWQGRPWKGLADGLHRLLSTWCETAFGAMALVPGLGWMNFSRDSMMEEGIKAYVVRILLGIGLALPFLFLFGSLMASADAVFDRVIRNLLDISFDQVFRHSLVIVGATWLVGGYLHGLVKKQVPTPPPLPGEAAVWRLGPIELNVALFLVNLLFLGFIVVQCRYLFGGSHLVEITPGLTYAQYARRGFFELVGLAALMLSLLLLADWLVSGRSPLVRRQSWGSILLLLVVLSSAAVRMRLYQQEYGLTELRVYVSACLVWLAVLFLWFGATVLRQRRPAFLSGALASAGALLLLLHGVNPDALIARINLQRAARGGSLDIHYALSLSADALPTWLEGAKTLPDNTRVDLMSRLDYRWKRLLDEDWRAWSYSRSVARQSLLQSANLEGKPPRQEGPPQGTGKTAFLQGPVLRDSQP